jgi:hypothetical protein
MISPPKKIRYYIKTGRKKSGRVPNAAEIGREHGFFWEIERGKNKGGGEER